MDNSYKDGWFAILNVENEFYKEHKANKKGDSDKM